VTQRDATEALDHLATKNLVYRQENWPTWIAVETRVNQCGLKSRETDDIVRPLIHELKTTPSPWTDILLLLSWDSLRSIHHLTRGYDEDQLARWSQVMWHFRSSLYRKGLLGREVLVGRKIFNDTKRGVRDAYLREIGIAKRYRSLSRELPEDDEGHGAPPWEQIPYFDCEFGGVEAEHDAAWACSDLDRLVKRGRLSKTDSLILVGYRIYGHPLQQVADETGLDYEVVKKRSLRASVLLKNIQRNMSP
jgi:hypothetical protein